MTCIVGIEHKNGVMLAGDSLASNSHSKTVLDDPKVFVKDNIAFGVCGLPKVMDLLNNVLKYPEHPPEQNDRSYLAGTLVPFLTDAFQKYHLLDEKGMFEGAVLIGYRKCVYQLESNFQLIRGVEKYSSVGSGSSYALGSLKATGNVKNPKKRLTLALEAAEANDPGVGGPFKFVSLKAR